MNKFSFNVMTLTLLSLLSFSSSADDLITVYKLAQQNDTQFRAAQAEYKALLESRNQSIAGFLPSISANAYYNQNDDKPGTSLDDYKTDGYSLNLVQPPYRQSHYTGLTAIEAVVAHEHANSE